jgi:hypothetical protein
MSGPSDPGRAGAGAWPRAGCAAEGSGILGVDTHPANRITTKGRSLLTQPRSAVAQAIGMSGYRTRARTAQPQIAFSNWLWTVAQSTSLRPDGEQS